MVGYKSRSKSSYYAELWLHKALAGAVKPSEGDVLYTGLAEGAFLGVPRDELEDNHIMNVSFDTLTAARDLEAAGLERPQAEAIVKTMRESGRADFANLPTKVDIAEIHTAIANLETRLLRWIVGTILTTAGVTVAIVRLLMA